MLLAARADLGVEDQLREGGRLAHLFEAIFHQALYFTTEARLLHGYTIGGMNASLAGGVRFSDETTHREQKGPWTTGSDFDLGLTKPYGIDLHLHTNNYAIFAENLFHVTPRFSVTPGFRYEIIDSRLQGVISNAGFHMVYTRNRQFALFGLGLQYQVSRSTQPYGNISQAYRPYLYASITPANQVGIIDPDLKDSRGYDADLGYRDSVSDWFIFDAELYYLYYGNRVGQLTLTDPATGSPYLYTTNIGNSGAPRMALYLDASLWRLLTGRHGIFDVRLFDPLSYTHARYSTENISNNGKNVSLAGNHVEGVPDGSVEWSFLRHFGLSAGVNNIGGAR